MERYDRTFDAIMKYSIPVVSSGATGFLLAENDIKSALILGLVTARIIYENIVEDLTSEELPSKLEQMTSTDK